MASSDLIDVSYVEESTFAETPDSALTRIPHTGGSFTGSTSTTRPGVIRGDAQQESAIRTAFEPMATLNFVWAGAVVDDLIKMILRSTWSNPVDLSGDDIEADADTGTFSSASQVDFGNSNLTQYQWIYVDGFDESTGNNGWYKVLAINSASIDVAPSPSETVSSSNTITFKGSYIRNGTDRPSATFQLEHGDVDQLIRVIRGGRVGQWSLSFSAQDTVTGSFEVMGTSYETSTTRVGSGSVNDYPDNEFFNSIDNVTRVFVDEQRADNIAVNEFSLQANMNARRRNKVGSLSAFDIGLGSLDLTGSLSLHLDDNTKSWLDWYIDFNRFGLAIGFLDKEGNGYLIEIPRLVLTNEPGDIPGVNEDVFLGFDFSAEPGKDYGKTIQVCRVQAS